jgi:alpha-ketoglutarate-dependent taurine dioxygenase
VSPVLQLRPAGPHLGVEALGVDLSEPLPAAAFDRLHAALAESGLLVVRRQSLSPEAQIAFTRRFGDIFSYTLSHNAHPDHPEVLLLSNLRRGGRPCGTPGSGRYWHTDGHYLRVPPGASILHALHVPRRGGDTLFANTADAYDRLPAALKARIEGLRVIISRERTRPYHYPDKPPVTDAERAAWPEVDHPVVRTHPVTGRKSLYVGGVVPYRIEGMAERDSNPLVTELQRYTTDPAYVHVHRWRAGDLVVWDNRTLIHRGTPYDERRSRRHIHRTVAAGEPPV